MNKPVEGIIELYQHGGGRIGVMVELITETEAASHSEIFRKFSREIALQITSAGPLYVSDEDIPPEVLSEVTQAALLKVKDAGKPEKVLHQIQEGAVEKYKNKQVLLRQLYIRDETITIAQLLQQTRQQLGEHIVIRRFLRWEICPDSEPPTA
jgi:elongation factor Ts